MNVALEVSTLGLAGMNRDSGYNRTGIYRLSSELLNALMDLDEISVYLLFWEYPYTAYFGQKYLKNKGLNVQTVFDLSDFEKKFYNNLNLVKMIPKINVFMNLVSKSIQKLKRYNNLESIDIFHSLYYPNPPKNIGNQILRFRTIHDLIPIKFPTFFPFSHQKKFLSNIKKIDIKYEWFFTVSQCTKNDLCDVLKIDDKRVIVNYPAASRHTFYPAINKKEIADLKRRLKIEPYDYLLSVATLEPRKNIKFLINCYKNLIASKEIDQSIKLLLVGKTGWMVKELLQKIEADPFLKNNVILTGYLPDHELRVLYSGSTAFIYPSIYEGFGLPVLEAMQCGAVVITSNTSSLPEVIGDAGITVDPKDENEMCSVLIDVVRDEK